MKEVHHLGKIIWTVKAQEWNHLTSSIPGAHAMHTKTISATFIAPADSLPSAEFTKARDTCYIWSLATNEMAKYPALLVILFLLQISCSENESFPNPEVSFYINDELFESKSSLNVYSIDNSPTGMNELGIHIIANKKDMLLFCTTDELEGTYTFLNSIEGELYNRIGLCDELDSIFCKTASKCETQNFVFTIERQQNNSQLLKGSFEGTVCNEDGITLNISDGTFKNFQLFP